MNKIVAVAAAIVLFTAAADAAVCWKVPENRTAIQAAIHDLASNGDTISVWGDEQMPYPYTYHEHVDYLGKSLVVVNRSFIESIPGYPPSWEHVVIDGSNQAGSVVTMTGSGSAVPRVVLKGFTITGGRSDDFGGGIHCEDVVAVLEKNHTTERSEEQ